MAAPPPGHFDNAKLRQLRINLGLKQTELAERIGVDPALLNNWEKRRGRPTANNLGRIASALGLEVSDLYRPDPTAAGTLADLRVHAGLGQRELARILNVSQAAVSRWERNAIAPPPELLPRYAQALGTPPTTLIHAAAAAPQRQVRPIRTPQEQRHHADQQPRQASTKRRCRTPEEVRQMRQLYEQGGYTFAELARRFDCNAAAVARICKGLSFPDGPNRKRCWPDADPGIPRRGLGLCDSH